MSEWVSEWSSAFKSPWHDYVIHELKTVRENTKSKRDCEASGGFEHKTAGFRKATLIYKYSVFLLLLLLHSLMLITSLLSKNGQNCRLVSLKTFMKSSQTRLLPSKISTKLAFFNNRFFGEIWPWFFRENGRFFCQFVSKNSSKVDFFQWPIRSPVLRMV